MVTSLSCSNPMHWLKPHLEVASCTIETSMFNIKKNTQDDGISVAMKQKKIINCICKSVAYFLCYQNNFYIYCHLKEKLEVLEEVVVKQTLQVELEVLSNLTIGLGKFMIGDYEHDFKG